MILKVCGIYHGEIKTFVHSISIYVYLIELVLNFVAKSFQTLMQTMKFPQMCA